MFFRKLRSAAITAADGKPLFKDKEIRFRSVLAFPNSLVYSFLLLILCFLLLLTWFPTKGTGGSQLFILSTSRENCQPKERKCDGKAFFYMYELPEKFNSGLLRHCRNLSVYTDMCPYVANRGLGQPLPSLGSPSWYATHQFIAEMIFHARAENHPCRTRDPRSASLFYVPFYGGLHVSSKFREPDRRERDRLAVELDEYLDHQITWHKFNGSDHFLALGRTAWDFMRDDDGYDFGANRLLKLPRVLNMSVLTVERHPGQGWVNQFGIPYTSYFHPSSTEEMVEWQEEMRRARRFYLFSFVCAPRTSVEKAAVRDQILRQCEASPRCHMVRCGRGASACHEPSEVLKVMTRSIFCMQPAGDSFTRRSVFDSVLAGCIPVFFSPHTAYTQYQWFFPAEPTAYSVYIPEDKVDMMEEELIKIPSYKVERMRKNLINLIPSITYTHPNATEIGFKDAVDVALEQLVKHVQSKLPLESL
ncbi:probable xyloglucan galactosyltransferase GT17 [Aristolochia californica]|uniref:probable xyloglucan galactosyltransferase GT17 n=1 Tax=Aristolochia californica TaxID=171875 RepID=UPI0035DC402E